ncbi:hypothetical protein Hanom_Chr16g01423831 [Helianthus anomalus]
MSYSAKVPLVFDLEELDSYSGPVQVMREPFIATSSKPSAPPKPTPQARTRASGSKKRKGSDAATAAPDGFSYDDLGFVESIKPMTSFLNKINIQTLYHGLNHLLVLFTEACEAVKILEAKLKKVEITITNQG